MIEKANNKNYTIFEENLDKVLKKQIYDGFSAAILGDFSNNSK